MSGEQYLRDLVHQRLAAVRGPEPDAAALYFFELRGAADALEAAELHDPGTATRSWRNGIGRSRPKGSSNVKAVGFGFHGQAEATTHGDRRLRLDRSDEPDRVVRADPLDVHVMDVDSIHLIADGLIRFTRGFEL